MTGPPRTAPSAWLALLVFADGFFVVLFALRDYSAWAVLGTVLAGLPLAGAVWSRRWDLPWFGPAAGLILSFLLSAVQGFPSDSIGNALLGGVLLGSPLAIMAAILRWSREPSILLPATFAGLVDLLTLNAALNRLGSQSALATPWALANTFVQVSLDQLNGFGGLLAGNASVSLPVQSLRDPVFATLALLALVG
ncbi:MAG: phosphoethanolamine transferase CptA, partial [Thermoplasmata archaeon]|nr:phosphoethanolamine transferase CptA [Thermoplasmata archaeon]